MESPRVTLTNKQKQVLDFIRHCIAQRRLPPTVREIAKHMGFSSTGTVRDYLAALAKKGFLTKGETMSRNISLKDHSFKIPILGSIPAGNPSLAYEHIEGYVDTDDLYLGRLSQDDVFALKVKGDSMIEAGILDGDIAIIKKTPVANDGEVVAAIMSDSDEATLKRMRKKDGSRAYLEPANIAYENIYKSFSIIGKLITVVRKY